MTTQFDLDGLVNLLGGIALAWAKEARRNEQALAELADWLDMPVDEVRSGLASRHVHQVHVRAKRRTRADDDARAAVAFLCGRGPEPQVGAVLID